jgi:uncharacterized membrane protein YciS (DUF1049 family)
MTGLESLSLEAMKLRLLMTALVGCVALICGAAIFGHFAKVRVSHRKLLKKRTRANSALNTATRTRSTS